MLEVETYLTSIDPWGPAEMPFARCGALARMHAEYKGGGSLRRCLGEEEGREKAGRVKPCDLKDLVAGGRSDDRFLAQVRVPYSWKQGSIPSGRPS